MANKLPWFTHDHDAHEDEFLQLSMDRFGHFGYAAYFITLELIHKHGCGDRLIMRRSRYASHLRSRMDLVSVWISFAERFGKLKSKASGDDIEIEINKFRERQSKMKSKITSTFPQPSVNLPIEGEGDKEREGDSGKPAKPAKIKHLDFVYLTSEEYQKLADELGLEIESYLVRLNGYIGSKGAKYKSHYHTILNWHRKDAKTAAPNIMDESARGAAELQAYMKETGQA